MFFVLFNYFFVISGKVRREILLRTKECVARRLVQWLITRLSLLALRLERFLAREEVLETPWVKRVSERSARDLVLVTIKLSKYWRPLRAWNRKNNDILPDPFNKDPLLGPYIEGPLSGHSLRRSSYFLKTALLSIFLSPGWVVLHYFLFLLWGEVKLLLLLIENLFLGQSYPFYDLQRIIWLKVSSKVAQGIYELTRGMTRGIPTSIPSFLEDLFVRFHLPWFTISQAHI